MSTCQLITALVLLGTTTVVAADDAAAVYDRACVFCHGATGRGDGPAAFSLNKGLAPRPRDFTRAKFKFRSTASGQPPTDDDLLRTIERGIPRYMPSFVGLSPVERRLAVVAIKRFSNRFDGPPPRPLPLPEAPPSTPEAITRGAAVYRDAGCAACHGDTGRGNGPSAKDLRDGLGLRIQPADLRFPGTFKNGAMPQDLYRTLTTGLDDTPMASYDDALSPAQRWDLIAYLGSLARR